jgi:hypothetical protein
LFIEELRVSGTEPFPGHGAYEAVITDGNLLYYHDSTGGFGVEVDVEYTIGGSTTTERDVQLEGTLLYRVFLDPTPTPTNEYMENVLVPMAQRRGALGVAYIEAEGTLPGLGYPISLVVVALAGGNATNDFVINQTLNDAWYFPGTAGQGVFVTVYPSNEPPELFLSFFAYEEGPLLGLVPPPMVGAGEHRWLTAFGPYRNGRATEIPVTNSVGGAFDVSPRNLQRSEVGTVTIEWLGCDSAVLSYDIPPRTGTIPLQRAGKDNVARCEATQEAAD